MSSCPPPPSQVPEQSPLNNEYYMLSLREGKLELRVNGGGGEAVLLSKRSFNDGRPYTVTVLKRRREYVLFSYRGLGLGETRVNG